MDVLLTTDCLISVCIMYLYVCEYLHMNIFTCSACVYYFSCIRVYTITCGCTCMGVYVFTGSALDCPSARWFTVCARKQTRQHGELCALIFALNFTSLREFLGPAVMWSSCVVHSSLITTWIRPHNHNGSSSRLCECCSAVWSVSFLFGSFGRTPVLRPVSVWSDSKIRRLHLFVSDSCCCSICVGR